MDAAIAALLGAFIGAAGSVGGMIIQQRSQGRRDLLKIAADLASEDWKNRYELISKRGGSMPPVSAFVRYHHKVLTALADDKFSEQFIVELSREHERILDAYTKANDEVIEANTPKA
jgi:hypothetical protein